MTQEEFRALDTLDVVRNMSEPDIRHVVIANYGNRVTLVLADAITDPKDWEVVRKERSTRGLGPRW